MQFRTFGKTGEQVSLLGFGAMRLPLGTDGKVDMDKSVQLLRHGIDNGVNYIDTAYVYHDGLSEVAIGKALKDGYREKVLLADKLPGWMLTDEASHQKIFDEQFKNLDVDVIDMYLLHNMTTPLWRLAKKLNTLDFLEKKKAEGKIRHIGFSFHDNVSLFKEIIDSYDWDFCMIQLNYMDTKWQAGVEGLKYAASKGVAVVVMEPLKGGLLTNTIPSNVESLWRSAETKRSPAEWGLRWVANFPEVMTITSGMSTMEQLVENLKIMGSALPDSLTEKEHKLIEEVSEAYNELIKYPCTACGYCMPCPKKINIVQIMNLYNEWFLFSGSKNTLTTYDVRTPAGRTASDCTNCKECEERCPQKLNISEMMANATKIFDK